MTERLLRIAHRGGNSLKALKAAEDAGVDVMETDVWLHRGVLEVRHERSMGPIPLFWDKWRLQGAWKPRLRLPELLAAARPGTGFMFDLKGRAPGLAHALVEATAPYADGRRLMVCSQHWPALEPFVHHPQFMVVHSIGHAHQIGRVWPLLDALEHDGVSIQYRLLNEELVRQLKERVSIVVTWPINDASRLARVRELGVDGVTSDSLELLRGI